MGTDDDIAVQLSRGMLFISAFGRAAQHILPSL